MDPILQFFGYSHLPPELQAVSKHFHGLAYALVRFVPRNPERTVALRKLLEAKDAAVRAFIYKEQEPPEYEGLPNASQRGHAHETPHENAGRLRGEKEAQEDSDNANGDDPSPGVD